MKRLFAAALLCALAMGTARADELSGADKLRVVYSNQFAWTSAGVPLVTVGLDEGRDEVTVSSTNPLEGVLLQPDGDGGASIRAGQTWTVRLARCPTAATAARACADARLSKVRWHVVVARFLPAQSDALRTALGLWRDRGFAPRTFELGSVFGVRGEVVDSRRVLVTVAPPGKYVDEAAARRAAAALAARFSISASVYPELAERPHATLEAVDERGTRVQNDSILWFAPAAGETLAINDIDNGHGGRETRRYFGRIYVTLDGKGKLAVVNAVPANRLLDGLVPAEMLSSAPTEALKAQAVAARNELLTKIGTRHLTDPFRLCSKQHCQVYAGAGRETARTSSAVLATRGELLVRDSGGLVDTVYSASCGGHTEDNDLAWGGTPDPALRGVLDGDKAAAHALSRFFSRVAASDLQAWLKLAIGAGPQLYCERPKVARASFRWTSHVDPVAVAARAAVGRLRDVQLLKRGVSGRVVLMRLIGDRGSRDIKGELEVRRALGNLKSSMITVELERDASGHLSSIVAHGGGHGHGVGMCQLGAMGMAEAGASYRDILKHYYQGAHVRTLY